jgi:hypothetical protein
MDSMHILPQGDGLTIKYFKISKQASLPASDSTPAQINVITYKDERNETKDYKRIRGNIV